MFTVTMCRKPSRCSLFYAMPGPMFVQSGIGLDSPHLSPAKALGEGMSCSSH